MASRRLRRTPPAPRFLSLSIRPWGFLEALAFVAIVSTAFGLLGRFSWFLDLFSHFRVQYALILGTTGGLLLAGRRFRSGGFHLAVAGLNVISILPLYMSMQPPQAKDVLELRAVLINVNSRLGDPDRVRAFVEEAHPDILVLEEISSRWAPTVRLLSRVYRWKLVIPRDDNFGIALLSRLRPDRLEVVEIGDAEVPSLEAVLRTSAGPLRVIATHPPPPLNAEYSGWRNRQLEALPARIPRGESVLVLGDLNITPWNGRFRELLQASGLVNSSKGFGVQGSWPHFAVPLRIPLDHCLHSPDIVTINRRIGPDVGSDHLPLLVDFAMRR